MKQTELRLYVSKARKRGASKSWLVLILFLPCSYSGATFLNQKVGLLMQNQRKCELTFYTQLTFVLIKLGRLLKVNCLKEAEISSDYTYSNYISDSGNFSNFWKHA